MATFGDGRLAAGTNPSTSFAVYDLQGTATATAAVSGAAPALTVGVFPAAGRPDRLKRLFGALEEAFPVRFEGRRDGELRDLDAVLELGGTTPRRGARPRASRRSRCWWRSRMPPARPCDNALGTDPWIDSRAARGDAAGYPPRTSALGRGATLGPSGAATVPGQLRGQQPTWIRAGEHQSCPARAGRARRRRGAARTAPRRPRRRPAAARPLPPRPDRRRSPGSRRRRAPASSSTTPTCTGPPTASSGSPRSAATPASTATTPPWRPFRSTAGSPTRRALRAMRGEPGDALARGSRQRPLRRRARAQSTLSSALWPGGAGPAADARPSGGAPASRSSR